MSGREISRALAAASLLGACFFAVGGCDGARPSGTPEAAPTPAPAEGGASATIAGRVVLAAGKPIPEALPLDDPCLRHEGRAPRAPRVDAKTRGIAGALVWVALPAAAERGAAPEPTTVVLDQRGCEFEPPVQVVAPGSTLLVRNSDSTLHNVHARLPDGRSLFNVGMTAKSPDVPIALEREGLIRVGCDVHPWMSAGVLVLAHRCFAITDEQGRFELRDVPAGRRKLHVWHPVLGEAAPRLPAGGEPLEVSLPVVTDR